MDGDPHELSTEFPAADTTSTGPFLGMRSQMSCQMLCPLEVSSTHGAGLSNGVHPKSGTLIARTGILPKIRRLQGLENSREGSHSCRGSGHLSHLLADEGFRRASVALACQTVGTPSIGSTFPSWQVPGTELYQDFTCLIGKSIVK